MRLTPVRHAALVGAGMMVALVAWRGPLSEPVLEDARMYVDGWAAMERTGSAYGVNSGYVYPPPFGGFGGWLVAFVGTARAAVVLHWSVAVGALVLLWQSVRLARVPAGLDALLVPLLACSAEPIVDSVERGNVHPIVAALVVAGLTVRDWRTGGALLGLTLALKPAALPAVVALLGWDWRRSAAAVVCGGALIAAAGPVEARAFLSATDAMAEHWGLGSPLNLAPHAALWRAGVYVPPALWMVLTGAAAAILAAIGGGSYRQRVCLALVACAVGAPVLWVGSLCCVVPVAVMGAAEAVRMAGRGRG